MKGINDHIEGFQHQRGHQRSRSYRKAFSTVQSAYCSHLEVYSTSHASVVPGRSKSNDEKIGFTTKHSTNYTPAVVCNYPPAYILITVHQVHVIESVDGESESNGSYNRVDKENT